MPSGAKKRKAAKKKKEKEANLNSSSDKNPYGNDSVKTQDEKESDRREIGSPASQDLQSHQHPFNDGDEEVEKSEPSTDRSFSAENKSMEGVTGDAESMQKGGLEDDSVFKIESELKTEDSDVKNDSIEHLESPKELCIGDDKISSSSSSDEEYRVSEKITKEGAFNSVLEAAPFNDSVKPVDSLSEEAIVVNENAQVEEVYYPVSEIAPVVDTVKPRDSVSDEVIHVTESTPLENSVVSDVVELGLKENVEKLLPKLDEVTGVVMDLASKKIEDKVLSDENSGAALSLIESLSKENEGKVLPPVGTPRTETNNGAECIKNSEIPEYSEDQPLVASAPRAVQTTSWMSCCGLFEVLTGSNR